MNRFNLSEIDKENADKLPPLVLAYIGDAVYEIYIRTKVVKDGFFKTSKLHALSSDLVKAKSQAMALIKIQPILSEEEKNIIRRGRNANSNTIPKHAELQDYKKATALEALVGYLFLREELDRLDELIRAILE